MEPTTLNVDRHDHTVVLEVLERRIFLDITERFREEVLREVDKEPPALIIDLSNVGVMNSAGLGVLLQAHDRMKKRSGRLILVGLQQVMEEIFSRMKLDSFFEICNDKKEALTRLHEPQK